MPVLLQHFVFEKHLVFEHYHRSFENAASGLLCHLHRCVTPSLSLVQPTHKVFAFVCNKLTALKGTYVVAKHNSFFPPKKLIHRQ